MPTRTATSSARRRASSRSPGNSIESPRLLLNWASNHVPGRPGQLVRPGRPQLHAAHDRLGLRGVREAGAHVSRHHHGRHHPGRGGNDPKRGFVGGYEMETLSLGLPFMAAFLNPGAWGRAFTSAMDIYDRHMAGMWIVGEDMPQETNRVTLHAEGQGQVRHAGPQRAFRRSPQRRRDAQPRLQAGRRVYEAVGATGRYPTPPYPSTHNLGTNRMSEKPADGVVNKMGPGARRQEPVRLGRQPVHHRRGRESDADDRLAGDPAGGPHRREPHRRRRGGRAPGERGQGAGRERARRRRQPHRGPHRRRRPAADPRHRRRQRHDARRPRARGRAPRHLQAPTTTTCCASARSASAARRCPRSARWRGSASPRGTAASRTPGRSRSKAA